MSRKTRKGKRSGTRFMMVEHYVFNCPAFRDLEPTARAVYLEIKKRYNGANNGMIGLGVREAGGAIKRSKSTAQRALDDLQQHGFIEPKTPSTFDQKKLAVEWLLTEHRDDTTGEPPRKTFMRWTSEGLPRDFAKKQKPVPQTGATVPPVFREEGKPVQSVPDSPAHVPVSLPEVEPQSHRRATYISAPRRKPAPFDGHRPIRSIPRPPILRRSTHMPATNRDAGDGMEVPNGSGSVDTERTPRAAGPRIQPPALPTRVPRRMESVANSPRQPKQVGIESRHGDGLLAAILEAFPGAKQIK